jgi:very-short-patch-repair endonuclease
MTKQEIIEYLSKLKSPQYNKFPVEVKQFLYDYSTEEIDDLKTLFYMWKQGIKEIPTCQYPNCNKKVRFIKAKRKFTKGCCADHSMKITNLEKYGVENPFQAEEVKEKMKQTNLKKYGVEHPMKSERIKEKMKQTNLKKYGGIGASSKIIREKAKQTNLKKYGVEYAAQTNEFKEKIKQTNLKKYGVEYPMQLNKFKEKMKQTNLKKYGGIGASSKIIREKMKQTTLKKYGVNHTSQTNEFKEKVKQTNLKKYGVIHASQTNEFKEKVKQTNLKKYGVENPMQNEQIREKAKLTNLKKYGVENPTKNEQIKEKVKRSALSNFYYQKSKFFKEKFDVELLTTIDTYNGTKENKYEFKCLKCGTIFTASIINGRIPSCPKCYPKNKSKMEIDLFNSINYPNKIQSDRNILEGKELDIVIPDKKIAIELDGIYWHSESNGKDKYYHLNKTELAEKKGYQLLHFWDIEYQNKKDIVLSIIHSKLGIYANTINSNECEIKEIATPIKDDFLEQNHIKGKDTSKVKLGLFYNDELVSVMTFDYDKQWVLSKFANKINYQIIGGDSKLFDYFVKKYKPQSIITYVDRRYSNKNLYEKLGFKFDGYTEPNDYYIKYGKLYLEKDKLENELDFFDENLTEWENIQLNEYDRIWDCGNYRFNFNLKT